MLKFFFLWIFFRSYVFSYGFCIFFSKFSNFIFHISYFIFSRNINNINIFLSLENPCTFLVAKEETWKHVLNTNSELSQKRTENQIMPFKISVNWLFNDMSCYLVIGYFDWKTADFQQTVVRVYNIFNSRNFLIFLWLSVYNAAFFLNNVLFDSFSWHDC